MRGEAKKRKREMKEEMNGKPLDGKHRRLFSTAFCDQAFCGIFFLFSRLRHKLPSSKPRPVLGLCRRWGGRSAQLNQLHDYYAFPVTFELTSSDRYLWLLSFELLRNFKKHILKLFRTTSTTSHLFTMLIILAAIILFHVISATLLFISTIDNAWRVSGNQYFYLWYACNSTCVPIQNSASRDAGYLQAVQASMILATILCCVGFFVFILQLFRLKQGERFVFTAIIQLLSALCVLIGASIFTAEHTNFKDNVTGVEYGYAFILAWIAFPLTFISGLMYLVLRKRK